MSEGLSRGTKYLSREGGCRRFCHFEGGPLQQPARRRACVPSGRTSVGAQCCSEAHLQQEEVWPRHASPPWCSPLVASPIPHRVQALSTCHSVSLKYLRDCCIGTHFPASGRRLRVQRMRTHFSYRAFSAAGTRCWNSRSPAIRLHWLSGLIHSTA